MQFSFDSMAGLPLGNAPAHTSADSAEVPEGAVAGAFGALVDVLAEDNEPATGSPVLPDAEAGGASGDALLWISVEGDALEAGDVIEAHVQPDEGGVPLIEFETDVDLDVELESIGLGREPHGDPSIGSDASASTGRALSEADSPSPTGHADESRGSATDGPDVALGRPAAGQPPLAEVSGTATSSVDQANAGLTESPEPGVAEPVSGEATSLPEGPAFGDPAAEPAAPADARVVTETEAGTEAPRPADAAPTTAETAAETAASTGDAAVPNADAAGPTVDAAPTADAVVDDLAAAAELVGSAGSTGPASPEAIPDSRPAGEANPDTGRPLSDAVADGHLAATAPQPAEQSATSRVVVEDSSEVSPPFGDRSTTEAPRTPGVDVDTEGVRVAPTSDVATAAPVAGAFGAPTAATFDAANAQEPGLTPDGPRPPQSRPADRPEHAGQSNPPRADGPPSGSAAPGFGRESAGGDTPGRAFEAPRFPSAPESAAVNTVEPFAPDASDHASRVTEPRFAAPTPGRVAEPVRPAEPAIPSEVTIWPDTFGALGEERSMSAADLESRLIRPSASEAGPTTAPVRPVATPGSFAPAAVGSTASSAPPADLARAFAQLDQAGETNHAELVRSLRLLRTSGGGDAHIRLEPDHFGDLDISLRVRAGQVSAQLRAESVIVRDWLQANHVLLRQALSDHGLTLDRLEVIEHGAESHELDEERQSQEEKESQEEYRPRRRRLPDNATFEVVA